MNKVHLPRFWTQSITHLQLRDTIMNIFLSRASTNLTFWLGILKFEYNGEVIIAKSYLLGNIWHCNIWCRLNCTFTLNINKRRSIVLFHLLFHIEYNECVNSVADLRCSCWFEVLWHKSWIWWNSGAIRWPRWFFFSRWRLLQLKFKFSLYKVKYSFFFFSFSKLLS